MNDLTNYTLKSNKIKPKPYLNNSQNSYLCILSLTISLQYFILIKLFVSYSYSLFFKYNNFEFKSQRDYLIYYITL